jgi:beta-1,4-mannooligosaccharide/beta-1,4-mannosyl-N-acetylglucosamine phosphorylase
MVKAQLPGSQKIQNMPWEEKPVGCNEVLWRSKCNPIILRNAIPKSNSIFNSAVVPYQGEFAGVFRCDHKNRWMWLHSGKSKDGIHWQIDPEPIKFIPDTPEIEPFVTGFDPRVVWIEDRYYIIWCNYFHGSAVGLGYTYDFEKFYQMENIFLPYNRNGVLFPRKINGRYAMLSRPSDNGHTPFGEIFYSESPDLCFWGRHRHVMGTKAAWESTKIGAGPIPIETSEGWLLIYHGVLHSCNGFVYSFGAALLDLEQPWKVIARSDPYLLSPQEPCECVGDVPNVVFPCAALVDGMTGRMAIYYGGADTVVCLAFAQVDELIGFIKSNSTK